MEACDTCGYEWDRWTAAEVAERLHQVGPRWQAILIAGSLDVDLRPAADVWSPLEYGCHVRDVLLNLRERIILGLAEDDPVPKPMFGALRIEVGMYAGEDPTSCGGQVTFAAALLARTIAAIGPAALERPIHYPWPRPATRTLRWVASQALHEAEHHLDDAQRILAG